MKTRELLLLCLFSFISMSVNAGQYQKNERKIRLEKHDSKNSPEKAGRSTIPFEVFAYLNSDYELISVDLKRFQLPAFLLMKPFFLIRTLLLLLR